MKLIADWYEGESENSNSTHEIHNHNGSQKDSWMNNPQLSKSTIEQLLVDLESGIDGEMNFAQFSQG